MINGSDILPQSDCNVIRKSLSLKTIYGASESHVCSCIPQMALENYTYNTTKYKTILRAQNYILTLNFTLNRNESLLNVIRFNK